MCGISGIVAALSANDSADLGWLVEESKRVSEAPLNDDGLAIITNSLKFLATRFDQLMSFGTYAEVATRPELRRAVLAAAEAFDRHCATLVTLSSAGRTDLDPVIEALNDYRWQLREELIGSVDRIEALRPAGPASRNQRFVAWTVEQILEAIDKLEVRGRDSAGVAIELAFDARELETPAAAGMIAAIEARRGDADAGDRALYMHRLKSGQAVATFVYKTANLIGRLGDNCAALRNEIRQDALFWQIAALCVQSSVLGHTRWASNGVISLPNCHPVNPSLDGDEPRNDDLGAMFVLNGDVDNYSQLVSEFVESRQRKIGTTITTDAKIIPIVHRWTDNGRPQIDRFRATLRRLEGSMAVCMTDPEHPADALLAQKGSGQSLYAARLVDGWMFASEIYGLASAARHYYDLSPNVVGGSVTLLRADSNQIESVAINDGETVRPSRETIQIFARDIFRGAYDYFLQKEIHDAPGSVEKTLRGRYVRNDGGVQFDHLPVDLWSALSKRAEKPIERIIIIGQGTAGVAAAGIAHLFARALNRNGREDIIIEARRSSELSGAIDNARLEDTLIVAVSQSGTTTDTNRAVDLARARGAFVHAIVNRRNSDLVRKSDSVIFTSDGRDVEMSVASTKAFYSQIAAGKLTALCLADQLGLMSKTEIAHEMAELERLPERIREVLALEPSIGECAERLAPRSRYWAVVGSAANHIAALEIRIKLSELCYKSIPVDFTEDKKHIDLSTEPLTLVIANDLPAAVATDIVKEVAIFRAHSGKPVVFTTAGAEASAFRVYAEDIIELPRIGADLAFVLATAAGHLWGFHAARAIDAGAQRIKGILVAAADAIETGDAGAVTRFIDELGEFVASVGDGAFDSGLSASQVAKMFGILSETRQLAASGEPLAVIARIRTAIPAVKNAFEEVSRPIDTIRHQAKTVTVGTTRPDDAVSLVVRDALGVLDVSESRMRAKDRRRLSVLSKLTDEVLWGASFSVETGSNGDKRIVPLGATPHAGAAAAGDDAGRPIGLFRRCLNNSEAVLGQHDGAHCVMVPLSGEDDARIETLVCLAIGFLPYAPRDQVLGVLEQFGRYDDLLAKAEEELGPEGGALLDRAIAATPPAAVVFGSMTLSAAPPAVTFTPAKAGATKSKRAAA
jgi:glutamine---fructose-6-phosphate transaminase (isomerizing)